MDAFNYGRIPGISLYFLSHFHYDHYQGLSKNFTDTVICSEITAKLVALKIRLNSAHIRALPMNEAVEIDKKAEVTLLDANHCPGAVMFLFKLRSGKTVLHCGDFRAVPEMEEYPALWNVHVDSLYLDTTYCKPEYDFPTQSEVISTTEELVSQHLNRFPNTLIMVGSYTIGKERVFLALAEKLDCKFWASTEKSRILKTMSNDVISRRLVSDPRKARIHVIEMRKLNNKRDLVQYRETVGGQFDHVLAVSPTGWNHSVGAEADVSLASLRIVTNGSYSKLSIPYSEHSSFSELRRFVKFLRLKSADCIIPTVNVGSPTRRNAMKKCFQAWIHDKTEPRTMSAITNFFGKTQS